MDTQNSAVTEIPNFKLAKVGKDRERKRGGAGWLGARGAGSGFSGAVGGSGAGAGFAGMSLAKTALSLMIAAGLSAGAWQFGKSFSAGASVKAKPAVKKVFDAKDNQGYADTSGVIKTETSIPNSMGYVSGSMDGLTPEERAKKAAEAEAARAAEEAAAKKTADEEAKKEAASPASGVPADPATIASTLGGNKKGLGEGKFGKLGSSFGGGGGLSGGAGLSGGINRNFGGASATGPTKVNNGSMSAFRNAGKPGYTSAGRTVAGKSKAKGFAKRQLDNAFAQSRQAMSAGKTENAAATAASAFDNNPGQGNVIAGPGVNNGARTGTADGGVAAPLPNGGGPLDTGGAACSPGMAPDINGNCQTIHTNHPKNGANYQWMIDTVKGLMVVLAVLAAMALIADNFDVAFGMGEFFKTFIRYAVGIVGAAILALGVMIMGASGDNVMGGIIAAIGGFVLYEAVTTPEIAGSSSMAAMGLVAAAGGFLTAANVKQPAAMQ